MPETRALDEAKNIFAKLVQGEAALKRMRDNLAEFEQFGQETDG